MQSIDEWIDWENLYHRLEIGQACFLLVIICTNIYFIARFSRISRVHLNFRILFVSPNLYFKVLTRYF
jgi:hypothetical protein